MELKSRVKNQSLLLTLSSVLFVTLFICDCGNIEMFWHLYIIPIVVAAVSYNFIRPLFVGVLGTVSMFSWSFLFGFCAPQYSDKLWEISIGLGLFLLLGIVVGQSYKTVMKQEKTLEGLSIKDRMTGLYNYKYFIDNLEVERKRALRYRNSLSVIIINLDFFDRITSLFGCEKGNEVTKMVAEIIGGTIRSMDTAAYYKTGKFVIALPNTNLEQASVVAERIRKVIAEEKFRGNKKHPVINMTISGGVASYPTQAEGVNRLIYEAEKALSEAKETGCNQICLCEK